MKNRRFSFDAERHAYMLGDQRVPSATDCLRVAGISPDWTRVDPLVLAHKRQLGTALHKALHLYLSRDLDLESVDPQIAPYFSAYLLFERQNGFKPERSEWRFIQKICGLVYAGTLDVQGLLRGQPYILDFKLTEGKPHHAWAVQLAAYAQAMSPCIIPPFGYCRGTLQLKPGGTYRFSEHDDPGDLEEFKSALHIAWRQINAQKEGIWER